jgi:hypothetical protein
MGHEILAAHPLLAPMRSGTEAERPIDQLEVQAIGVLLEYGSQIRSQIG